MKRFKDGLMAAILVVGLMGFLGNNVLGPVSARAEEKKADVKKEAAVKDDKAVKKATAPAKKAKKKGPPPVVSVASQQQIVVLIPQAKIDIMGTGFEPKQELRILYTDDEGMQTDIGYALKPEVKANNSGAFFTTWDAEEFIKAKLLTEGAKTITITNSEFKPLAETNIFFKEAPKAPKKEVKKEAKKAEPKAEKKAEKAEKAEKKAEKK